VVISNTIITQNLYAEMGNVARLTVNRLLSSNILDAPEVMNYIDIRGQYITFIKGVKDTSKPQKQYKNEKDENLYWEDSTRTNMSTTVSDYPVMVYQYDTSERLKIYFDENTDTFYPKIIWGEGNGTDDQQKAFMYKDETGFSIDYIKDGGEKLSLKLGEDGVLLNGSPISAVARFL
ncbi:MAG: hypothetical protein ACYDG2_01240, partial [Ruminiclostridium sp.]